MIQLLESLPAAVTVSVNITKDLPILQNKVTDTLFSPSEAEHANYDQRANHQSTIKSNYIYFTYRFLQEAIDVRAKVTYQGVPRAFLTYMLMNKTFHDTYEEHKMFT